MTITVVANDVSDARFQLGLRASDAPIQIKWRKADAMTSDYKDVHLTGCVVDATHMGSKGGNVPLEFENAKAALRHIAKLLNEHEVFAKQAKAYRDKKDRSLAKEAKAKK